VRIAQLTLGLALFLLVIVTYQPFRDVQRGRAAERALAGPPTPIATLEATPPFQAVYVVGVLQAERDVRREWPVESAAFRTLLTQRVEHSLVPGTRLRDDSGEIALEGDRVALAGKPTDYPYGAAVAVYGTVRPGTLEVWALGPDAAALARLAWNQTALLHWPALLVGLALAVIGYGLALAGTCALGQAVAPEGRGRAGRGLLPFARARPRLAVVALCLYLMIGFGLLGSAWAMLWPMIAGGALTALVAWQRAK
jgi:hypothetical protein